MEPMNTKAYRRHYVTLALVGVLGACGFTDGDHWASATVSFTPTFDSAGRDAAALPTTTDFEVRDLSISATFDALVVSQDLATDGGTDTFDPADPPAGYSLCHNGHCHADSGELVDYEDIQAELSAEDSSVRELRVPIDTTTTVTAGATARDLACSECTFDRGMISSMQLDVTEWRVTARVFDRRTGDQARIPTEGIDLDLTLNGGSVSTPLGIVVGPGRAPDIHLTTTFSVAATAFDGVDFSAVDDATISALEAAFIEASSLAVSVSR